MAMIGLPSLSLNSFAFTYSKYILLISFLRIDLFIDLALINHPLGLVLEERAVLKTICLEVLR